MQDIILALLNGHPKGIRDEELMWIVYLADWRSTIKSRNRLLQCVWTFGHYGPETEEFEAALEQYSWMFKTSRRRETNGIEFRWIQPEHPEYRVLLEEHEHAAVEHVLSTTSSLDRADLVRLVYSTFPMLSSERFTTLNLEDLADKYVAFRGPPKDVSQLIEESRATALRLRNAPTMPSLAEQYKDPFARMQFATDPARQLYPLHSAPDYTVGALVSVAIGMSLAAITLWSLGTTWFSVVACVVSGAAGAIVVSKVQSYMLNQKSSTASAHLKKKVVEILTEMTPKDG